MDVFGRVECALSRGICGGVLDDSRSTASRSVSGSSNPSPELADTVCHVACLQRMHRTRCQLPKREWG
jgi:hypothetical protein